MGVTEVTVEIGNPRDRGKWRTLAVIADTGAIFSVFPRAALEELGITPYAEETFHLADGREIQRQAASDKLLRQPAKSVANP